MKVHLRFDDGNEAHQRMTVFINGRNMGGLCMTPAEAVWFHHVLQKGCDSLSPPGGKQIKFVASGRPFQPTDEEIDIVIQCPTHPR